MGAYQGGMKRILSISLLVVSSLAARAVDKSWNVSTGDWSTGGNWAPVGAPGGGDNAWIQNGGTATITSAVNGSTVRPGQGTGSGTVNVNAGGTLNAVSLQIGNDNGTGTVNVNGGTINANSGGNWLMMGRGAGNSTGHLNIASGTVTSAGPLEFGYDSGNKVNNITQSGGVFTINGTTRFNAISSSTTNIDHQGGSLAFNNWVHYSDAAGSNTTINQSGGTVSFANNVHVIAGNGTLNISGGTVLQTGGTRFDFPEGRSAAVATGRMTVSGNSTVVLSGGDFTLGRENNANGTLGVQGGVVTLNKNVQVGMNGRGTWVQSGGSANVTGGWVELAQSNNGQGTLLLSGGSLSHSGAGGAFVVGSRGASYGEVSGNGVLNVGQFMVGAGHEGQTFNATFRQTGGTVLATSVFYGNNNNGTADNAAGILHLEGGMFRFNTLNAPLAAGSQLNWGATTLAPRTFDSGNASGSDLSAGTGFTDVRSSNATFVTNSNLTSGNGTDQASRIDLGGLYLSGVSVLFDDFSVANGRTLNLASNADVLELNDDTAYLLRPFGFFTEDYGSLPLVSTTGGGTITGTFDTFLGITDDGRGWSQYTGAFTSASALPTNTWYLEQTASAITFHYKVAGTVPEPGTCALLAMGALGLRVFRKIGAQRARFPR